jgi:hypothetical protein
MFRAGWLVAGACCGTVARAFGCLERLAAHVPCGGVICCGACTDCRRRAEAAARDCDNSRMTYEMPSIEPDDCAPPAGAGAGASASGAAKSRRAKRRAAKASQALASAEASREGEEGLMAAGSSSTRRRRGHFSAVAGGDAAGAVMPADVKSEGPCAGAGATAVGVGTDGAGADFEEEEDDEDGEEEGEEEEPPKPAWWLVWDSELREVVPLRRQEELRAERKLRDSDAECRRREDDSERKQREESELFAREVEAVEANSQREALAPEPLVPPPTEQRSKKQKKKKQ